MRLGAVPETPLEWLALRAGRIPTPLVDTHLAFAFARTLMVAVRLGVFEALADGDRTAGEVARRCATAEAPTARLLHALVGMGYLRPGRTADRVGLTRGSRRWLTRASPDEVLDKVLFGFDEWRFVEGYEAYVRDGRAIDMHAALGHEPPDAPAGEPVPAGEPAHAGGRGPAGGPRPAGGPWPTQAADDSPTPTAWVRYQRGLRAVAGVSAAEVARRTPIPRGARRMLDIGGAHGRFAAAILRRHPRLTADVLELPEAVAASSDLLAAEGMGDRLRHRAGDALSEPLHEGEFDVVFASQFNHHLGDDANRTLAHRVAAALRPGGVYVIQDLARPADAREARRARLGALLDLYFGATSDAGTYTVASMRAWQAEAGLTPLATRWLRTLPGLVQQVGVRP
jgi:SAM-dependent methyltransferase